MVLDNEPRGRKITERHGLGFRPTGVEVIEGRTGYLPGPRTLPGTEERVEAARAEMRARLAHLTLNGGDGRDPRPVAPRSSARPRTSRSSGRTFSPDYVRNMRAEPQWYDETPDGGRAGRLLAVGGAVAVLAIPTLAMLAEVFIPH